MEIHPLKTWPRYFRAVITNRKTVEVRKADRDFKVGDVLELREFDPTTESYSGNRCLRLVTDVLAGGQFGIEDGYVAMSLSDDLGKLPETADKYDKYDKILHDVLRACDPEDYSVGLTTGEDAGERWIKIVVANART